MSQPLAIRRIGWAGYVITSEAGTRVIVDPYLHGSEGVISGLPESPITVEELAGAALAAVTHAGYDHRAQAIDIALAGEAILVGGPALSRVAVDSGVPAERSGGILSGCTFDHGDVRIKSLPARHWSGMRWTGEFIADQPIGSGRPTCFRCTMRRAIPLPTISGTSWLSAGRTLTWSRWGSGTREPSRARR
jgi:L-ascorbate metabolism protein UlaG (beta-lactamase superfamily)